MKMKNNTYFFQYDSADWCLEGGSSATDVDTSMRFELPQDASIECVLEMVETFLKACGWSNVLCKGKHIAVVSDHDGDVI